MTDENQKTNTDLRVAKQEEDSLTREGQRNTSILWENTQRDIALTVVYITMLVAGIGAVAGGWIGLDGGAQTAAFVFLYGVANLVIGFYFGRTNHQRVGGPGGDDVEGGR